MENISSLFILIILEIILGIDNIIFISIVLQNIQQKKLVRYIGLSLALIIRIIFLWHVMWLMKLDINIAYNISIKDIILWLGGIFLIVKSVQGLYKDTMQSGEGEKETIKQTRLLLYAIIQVIFVDIIFSLDSVLVAIAMTKNITIITIAFAVAMLVMVSLSGYSVRFLQQYPRLKTVSLLFIMMIGALLIAEGMDLHIPKGYLYFAFVFSLFNEFLNIIAHKGE